MSDLLRTDLTYFAVAAISLSIGYSIGLAAAKRNIARNAARTKPPQSSSPEKPADEKAEGENHSDSESEIDEDLEFSVSDGDLSAVKPGREACKLVREFYTPSGHQNSWRDRYSSSAPISV